jgi:hypothetical protein
MGRGACLTYFPFDGWRWPWKMKKKKKKKKKTKKEVEEEEKNEKSPSRLLGASPASGRGAREGRNKSGPRA